MGQTELKTIVAVSTAPGTGGIAVVRMSGSEACAILEKAWKGKSPNDFLSHTSHLGWITDSDGEPIDQVVATYFKAPNSYTGEDILELSCHGSQWIQQALTNRMIECGASAAGPGEFTQRAFFNGKLDLAQAEGVGDLITASSKASARLAVTQLKGEYSNKLKELRNRLIDLGSLMELELDFSEEDVEFADRKQLIDLADRTLEVVKRLAESYRAGKVFKKGIPVVIAGIPNAGKSSLLNALLGEEKAIVTDEAGTTRDIIEDTVELGGYLFRFYDTAGLRESDDKVESIGIERARNKMAEANILLKLFDPSQPLEVQKEVLEEKEVDSSINTINILTKEDLEVELSEEWKEFIKKNKLMAVSSSENRGIGELKDIFVKHATSDFNPEYELVVTNGRHYESLVNAIEPLERLKEGLENGLSGDFLAQDLREAIHYLGTITGEVTSTDILHTIFSRYCIGK